MTLRPSDCHPGTLVQCIAADDEIYLGEIYTIHALHEPPYLGRDGIRVQAHSISLHEVGDNANAAGDIDVFKLELFRLVPREEAEAAKRISERGPVFDATPAPLPIPARIEAAGEHLARRAREILRMIGEST